MLGGFRSTGESRGRERASRRFRGLPDQDCKNLVAKSVVSDVGTDVWPKVRDEGK